MTILSAASRLPHPKATFRSRGRALRHGLSGAIVAFACAAPSLAFAQAAQAGQPATNPNCPPGSWFCADTQEKPAAPAGQPVQQLPADRPAERPLAPLPGAQRPPVTYAPAPQPPVVIYQPPPPVIIHE